MAEAHAVLIQQILHLVTDPAAVSVKRTGRLVSLHLLADTDQLADAIHNELQTRLGEGAMRLQIDMAREAGNG